MIGALLQAALLLLAVYPLVMRGLAAAAGPRRARLAELGRELLASPFAALHVKTAVHHLLAAAFDPGLAARLAARFPLVAARNLTARPNQPLRISGPAHGLCAEFARACLWSAFAANPLLAAILVFEIAIYTIVSRAWPKPSSSPAAIFFTAALPGRQA